MYKIVEKKKIWFLISAAIIVVGIVFGCIRGLNFGIDFLGGSKVVLDCKEGFDKDKADEIVNKHVSDAVTNTVENQEDGKKQYEIKSTSLDSEKFADLFTELKNDANIADEIASQEEVGASFGADLAKNSLIALGIAFVAMLMYIAIRFEFKFGLAALMALVHDVLITLAFYAVSNMLINTPFVAAILTIIGYSINATIVIFDRIRENNKSMRTASTDNKINKSITQTMSRSVNTSLTTLFTIVAVSICVPSVREFALPIIVGILSGTYSSIVIAPSIYSLLKNKSNKKKTTAVKSETVGV
ncbi:MAG: protein translocase subunit SecF [Clostridium sp.]|nr:protein translocase subunit SecF [Clostridium sp.]MDY3828696.1 protein translocase subunit SecF [Clostridium sp.]